MIRDDPDRAGHLTIFWSVAMLALSILTTLKVVRLGIRTVRLTLQPWSCGGDVPPGHAPPRKEDPDKARK